MIRPNPLKARLAGGGTAYGTMIFEFFTAGLPAIAQAAGAEFLLLDMEHSGVSIETVKTVFAGCRGLDIAPMVRVPTLQYHFIARALDAGAMGVMVPMVETAEQAAEFVAATRYPPDGKRGAAFGVVAHDGGRRFLVDSSEARSLLEWIASGAKDDLATASKLVRLDVLQHA